MGSVLAGCSSDPAASGVPGAVTDTTEARLLRTFQPILAQKLAADYSSLPYPITSDLIGTLSLEPDPEGFDYAVVVNTGAPVMYSQIHTAELRGRSYTQLLYAIFYPERPVSVRQEDNFFEWLDRFVWSGLIDGKVIRITLDAARQYPLFVEVARNCGCSWQLFVNKLVDDEARAEFEDAGLPYPGLVKPEAPHDVQYVWVMPQDLQASPVRVVVVAEEGWGDAPHNVLGAFTSYDQWLASGTEVDQGLLYQPADAMPEAPGTGMETRPVPRIDYAGLYELSPDGGTTEVGLCDAFGYVWNAYSPLTELMRAFGASKFPGTPRDPAELEVVHETLDFWNTSLYEQFIHLPLSIFGEAS
jgi:hypothetical protein